MNDYLMIALGVWMGATLVNRSSYSKATTTQIINGIIGCLLWPLSITLLCLFDNEPMQFEVDYDDDI